MHSPRQGRHTRKKGLVNVAVLHFLRNFSRYLMAPRARLAPSANAVAVALNETCSSRCTPRYLYSGTRSYVLLPNLNSNGVGVFRVGRKWTTWVFSVFTTILHFEHQSDIKFRITCNLFSSGAIRTKSSAYNSKQIWVSSTLTPQPRSLTPVAKSFKNIANKVGESVSPCLTPQ